MSILISPESAKRFIQNSIFSSKASRFSKAELLESHPELIKASRLANARKIPVYRVLGLMGDDSENTFGIDSTTTSLESCLDIAVEMPSLVLDDQSFRFINSHIFKFSIPNDRILIDYNAILPALKESTKPIEHETVIDKEGHSISIKKAIGLYEKSNENEIIADLEGLSYKKAFNSSPMQNQDTYKSFKNKGHHPAFKAQQLLEDLKVILPKSELIDLLEWNRDFGTAQEEINPWKSEKITAQLDDPSPAF